MNREVAVAVLDSLGCRVTVAEDGRQAVEACRAGRFDVVLMDIQMPFVKLPLGIGLSLN